MSFVIAHLRTSKHKSFHNPEQLPVAALALLSALAAPAVHAQTLGDVIGKAKNAAKDALGGKSQDGDGSSKNGDSGSSKDGKSRPLTLDEERKTQPWYLEKQLSASLRKAAPKNAVLLVLSYKGDGTFTGSCLVCPNPMSPTPKVAAVSLRTLPTSVKAQFTVLRATIAKAETIDNVSRPPEIINKPWEVCHVVVPCIQEETFGDENDGKFEYGYKELKGDADNTRAYRVTTPALLFASYKKLFVKAVRDQKAEMAVQAKIDRENAAAVAAGGGNGGGSSNSGSSNSGGGGGSSAPAVKAWTCTWCKETVQSADKPDYHGCTVEKAHEHSWHAQ